MSSPRPSPPSDTPVSDAHTHDILVVARRVITHRLTRATAAWLLVLVVAIFRWQHAYHCFDATPTNDESTATERDKRREDGNNGHTWIDFGGQYVFGRTAAEGHWRHLYDRNYLRRTAEASYPIERQSPAVQKYHRTPEKRPPDLEAGDVRTDADSLLRSMMGDDNESHRDNRVLGAWVSATLAGGDHPLAAAAVATLGPDADGRALAAMDEPVLGGPLYPPVHALFYAPLGHIKDAQLAYFFFQLASVVSVFGSGLAVRVLSNGRVWCSVATLVLLLMPGMRPGLDLGQNQTFTLLIVLGGWAIASRYSEFGGGMVWGLLAFKPVWGLAFILAPLLLRKWKFVSGTAVAGISVCLATLPLVGIEGWQNWWQIGRSAADLYNVDENWINLSRDVSGIPKRLFLDFKKPRAEVGDESVNAMGNGLLVGLGLTTVLVGVFGGGTIPRAWRVARAGGLWAAAEEFALGRTTSYIGLRAAVLLFGGWLCCYRFMYYDSVLIAVGLSALLAHPRWQLAGWRAELREAHQSPARRRVFVFANSVPLTVLIVLLLADNVLLYCGQQVTLQNDHIKKTIPDPGGATVTQTAADGTEETVPKTVTTTRQVKIRFDYNHPVETYLCFALWLWCGWRLVRNGDREKNEPESPEAA